MLRGAFSSLDVRVVEDDLFMLIKPCRYKRGCFQYVVPEGFKTDFASIPRPLLWLFKRNGKSRVPSVFHDHMLVTKWHTRKEADRMYRQMLRDVGMSEVAVAAYFAGVTLGRWVYGEYKK